MHEQYRLFKDLFGVTLVLMTIFVLAFVASSCDAQEVGRILPEVKAQRHYQGIRAAAFAIVEFETDPMLVNTAQRIIANSEEPADGNMAGVCYLPSLRTILTNGYRGQARALKLYGGDSEQNVFFSTMLIHATILTEGVCDFSK